MSRVAVCIAVITVFSVAELFAETYAIDRGHSSVQFSVRHLVSRTSGRFNEYAGSISYDPDHPGKTAASATIQVGSIDTDNAKRDGHLKSADFFDVANHPLIAFKSTNAKTQGDKILLSGDLTMHGITKKVELPRTSDESKAGSRTNHGTHPETVRFRGQQLDRSCQHRRGRGEGIAYHRSGRRRLERIKSRSRNNLLPRTRPSILPYAP